MYACEQCGHYNHISRENVRSEEDILLEKIEECKELCNKSNYRAVRQRYRKLQGEMTKQFDELLSKVDFQMNERLKYSPTLSQNSTIRLS